MKLEIFGDSILRGVIYAENSSNTKKYRLCSDHRFESFRRDDIAVSNRSRMGFTISDGLRSIEKSVSGMGEDTFVLLEFGGNDCDYDWKAISDNPRGEFLPNLSEEQFVADYCDAIDRIQQTGAKVIVSSIIPIDAEKYMSYISRGLDGAAILSWLGDVSMLYRWQEHYNHLIEKISLLKNCALLDLRRAFLTAHNFKQLLCDDGIHPTELGHALIRRNLLRFLTSQNADRAALSGSGT